MACHNSHSRNNKTDDPGDPPVPPCEGEIVGRMMVIEDHLHEPPTITHGVLLDDDCDELTPPIFVPDEDFPGQGVPYRR